MGEVTEWSLYHGTRTDLKPGDLIEPGHNSNHGERTKASYVYLARTLDAAHMGGGAGRRRRSRQSLHRGTDGPIEDDPDLTNKKLPGAIRRRHTDLRRRYGSRPRITDWQGHSSEAPKTMKDFLDQLERGAEAIGD